MPRGCQHRDCCLTHRKQANKTPSVCCRHISTFPTRETRGSLRKAATISLPPSNAHASASNGRNPLHPQSYLQGSIDNVAASFPSSPHKSVEMETEVVLQVPAAVGVHKPLKHHKLSRCSHPSCALSRISVGHMVQHVGKF